MPYDEFELDDPHELVGIELPGEEATTRDMAAAFAEEYARMGLGRAQILAIFHRPFYAAAHQALRLLGEDEIARLVDESVNAWGRYRVTVEDTAADEDDHSDQTDDRRLVRPNGFLKVLR